MDRTSATYRHMAPLQSIGLLMLRLSLDLTVAGHDEFGPGQAAGLDDASLCFVAPLYFVLGWMLSDC